MSTIINPVHVLPFHIPLIKWHLHNEKRIYITPKVDGVRSQHKINGEIYECEIVNNRMYLYDYIGISFDTYCIKSKILEKILGMKILYQIKSINEINKILKYFDDDVYPSVIGTIFPKPVFMLHENSLSTEEWQILFDFLLQEYTSYFPNDGWIVYIDDYIYPIKFKPLRHLTIDVYYNINSKTYFSGDDYIISNVDTNLLNGIQNNCVVRCYWNNNENKWIPIDIRNDKKTGNKLYVINLVSNAHKNKINYGNIWKSINIQNMTYIDFPSQETNIKPYYSHNEKVKKPLHNMNSTLKHMKNIFFQSIDKILNIYRQNGDTFNILDLGCGKGLLNSHLKDTLVKYQYTGIDIDPIILSYAFPEGNYYWNNLNTDFPIGCKYSHTFFINSLHYVDNIHTLFERLSKVTSYVVILGMFSDNYIKNINIDGITVIANNNDNNEFEFSYPWKDDLIAEKILSKKNIFNITDELGWKLVHIENYKKENNFIQMHEILVFQCLSLKKK